MQTTHKSFFAAAAPLLLLLFIDGMGLSLVFPLLNALIIDPAHSILPAATSFSARNLIMGIVISSAMLAWFLGSSFLGDLSDQVGRKKTLLVCLLGAALGYLFSAWGAEFNSLTLIILGRIVAGLTAGSQPVAQAAIVDLSTPETKARNIGWVLLVCSLGFILGPLLGGVLSSDGLVSWFNMSTPFYFATIISLLNAVLLLGLFKETFYKTGKIKIKFHRAIEIFVSAFTHKKIRNLSIILLIMILGWSSFYGYISMFLLERYGFTPLHVGVFMAVLGIGFGVTTGFLVGYLSVRFSHKRLISVCLALAALCALIISCSTQAIYAWLLVAPLSGFIGIAYSVLLTLFSNQAGADSQGWVMGITNAVMATAFFISGIGGGVLAGLNPVMPLVVTVGCVGLSALLILKLHTDAKKPDEVVAEPVIGG